MNEFIEYREFARQNKLVAGSFRTLLFYMEYKKLLQKQRELYSKVVKETN